MSGLQPGDLLEPGYGSRTTREPHPPEVLQHMRDRLAKLERQGIEAIND